MMSSGGAAERAGAVARRARPRTHLLVAMHSCAPAAVPALPRPPGAAAAAAVAVRRDRPRACASSAIPAKSASCAADEPADVLKLEQQLHVLVHTRSRSRPAQARAAAAAPSRRYSIWIHDRKTPLIPVLSGYESDNEAGQGHDHR
jgi:hypothetical protein